MYGIAITYGIVSLLLLGGYAYFTFKIIFMSSSMKDFLDKFFDLCREYQQVIPPQKMAKISREYADRLDEWLILADLRRN